MTFSNAQSLSSARHPAIMRACGLGLALALTVPCLAATAATPQAGATAVAKSKVSQIDFKRGDGGAGRLILRFDGDGAAPDLRNQDGSVVVDVANASLPAELIAAQSAILAKNGVIVANSFGGQRQGGSQYEAMPE